jgi:hypothetical protein
MSKRFILASLLILLTSACTRQVTVVTPPAQVQSTQFVTSNTAEAGPTATATPLILAAATEQPLPIFESACPGASAPHVTPGQQVSVVSDNTDKLKLRSEPKISPDTLLMDLDQFTQLKILEGFICVHSDETGTAYWFWKVQVIPTGEIGWVAEGTSSHYFIEADSGQSSLSTFESICPGAPIPHVATGQEVTVVADDTNKLKLRSEPKISPETMVRDLDKLTQLKILDRFACAYSAETDTSYWFWNVEVIATGEIGWVAEGDSQYYFIE